MVRESPRSTLWDVREEAIALSLETSLCNTKTVKSRTVLCESTRDEHQYSGTTKGKQNPTFEDIVRVVSEQSKAIGV